jgi:hypothetical protein
MQLWKVGAGVDITVCIITVYESCIDCAPVELCNCWLCLSLLLPFSVYVLLNVIYNVPAYGYLVAHDRALAGTLIVIYCKASGYLICH